MDPIHSGLITLLRSAITGEKLTLPENFSLEIAAALIKAQGLVPLVYAGARNCGIPAEDPFLQKLWPAYLRHALRSERQMQAVRQLLARFEEEGIDYLPLKGCVMKPLYPAPELRVMGDADILIRMEQYDRIRPIVEDLGYVFARESRYDYEWKRADLYLELHHSMISPAERDLYSLLGTGWSRAVKSEGHCFVLGAEDTFLFLFAHMTKHYRFNGIGSRHMVDLYVFLRSHPELDRQKLEASVEALGLGDFYRNVLRLLSCWFEGVPSDPVTEAMITYIFSGGSFGLAENGIHTEAARKNEGQAAVRGSRRKTILRTLFPEREKLARNYPCLNRFPFLLPLMWLRRWMEVLLRRPSRIGKKLRMASETTDEKVLARKRALEYVGLTLIPEPAEQD